MERAEGWHCDFPRESTGNGPTSVAIKSTGVKKFRRKDEAWHHMARLAFLKGSEVAFGHYAASIAVNTQHISCAGTLWYGPRPVAGEEWSWLEPRRQDAQIFWSSMSSYQTSNTENLYCWILGCFLWFYCICVLVHIEIRKHAKCFGF